MLIIPAIDIQQGKCVRLYQGQMDKASVYFEDPTEAAAQWIEQGAQRLHLVNLDGAVGKTTSRQHWASLIQYIKKRAIAVQLGGGIRDLATARYYLEDCQADYIILGTWAIKHPQQVQPLVHDYPQRIYLGLDLAGQRVQLAGWLEEGTLSPQQALLPFADSPLAGIIVTDTQRDGTLQGINLEVFSQLAEQTDFPLIVGGGVRQLADIQQIKDSQQAHGVICGKALYEGHLQLPAALQLASSA